ncbi:MAG: selenocysteine-specific translation elongation factor [Thermoanaerobaculia bacterium]
MPDTHKRKVVGTAGHIDHGKTALVRALTGVDCDRLPEEKRRGITIDLGFASLQAGQTQISFIDVPGHERFVKNMLAGVGGIDSVLLVVAADESIKPQTREHFAICRLLRIPSGVVAITKSDLVDPEIVEIVRLEIEELVRGSFLEGAPIIPVSSVTGSGVDELREAMIESLDHAPERDVATRVFRLPIDRVFTLKGFGVVVTGTTISGSVDADAEIEILPDRLGSRVRNLQVHGAPRETARAGERTSINLADVPLERLRRGQQITTPGALRPSQILTARLQLLDDSKPLKDQTRIRFHLYSAELLGSVRLLEGEANSIAAGEDRLVQIRLESPVTAVSGDRFVIRRYSPSITIGGGVILDPHLSKLSRGTRSGLLEPLEHDALPPRVALLTRFAGIEGFGVDELEVRTGILQNELLSRLAGDSIPEVVEVPKAEPRRWIHRDVLSAFRRTAMDLLSDYFNRNRMALGVPKSEFLQKLMPPSIEPAVAEFLLRDLEEEKIATLAGDLVDVPGRSKRLSGVEGDLARTIEERFRVAGLQPPPVSQLIQTIAQKPKVIEGVIGYLVKTGVLVRLAEGIYLHKEVVADARARVESHGGETADVAWFKDFFGLSRKIVIPLLEHFDRLGVTRREGDRRQIL